MKDFSKGLRLVFLELMPAYLSTMGDKITQKQDGTPAGNLDFLAMEKLREYIKAKFPDDLTIGEEDGFGGDDMELFFRDMENRYWTIDGLDGTGNRQMGTTFGAMVSCRQGNEILYSAFFQPVDQALHGNGFYHAELGKGAWQWNGKPMADECPQESQILAAHHKLDRYTFLLEGSSKKVMRNPRIARLAQAGATRLNVSSCLSATIVARGKASALVTVENAPWDTWPAVRIIKEAGGTVTDWNGNPVTPANCGSILASGNAVDHEVFLELLRP